MEMKKWLEQQQKSRLGYMSTMLLIQGCVLAPMTLWTMHLAGDNDAMFFILTSLCMAVLVPNLADMPTKITIPIFAVSAVVCVFMILINVARIIF